VLFLIDYLAVVTNSSLIGISSQTLLFQSTLFLIDYLAVLTNSSLIGMDVLATEVHLQLLGYCLFLLH